MFGDLVCNKNTNLNIFGQNMSKTPKRDGITNYHS